MGKHQQNADDLARSGTNIVMTCGTIGSGKTCFLLTIIQYLFQHYQCRFNTQYNKKGIQYLKSITRSLDKENTLPPATSRSVLGEIDLQVNTGEKNIFFTFMDIAGEDFNQFDPAVIGELNKMFEPYFTKKDVNITLLCFIDIKNPKEQDQLMNLFFSHIEQHFKFDFLKVAVIGSKWDCCLDRYKNFLEFFTENNLQVHKWINSGDIKHPEAFPFSIGKVIVEGNTLENGLDFSYCQDIVKWLFDIAETEQYYQNQADSPKNLYSNVAEVAVSVVTKIFKIFAT